MKLIIKSLLLSLGVLTLVQPAAANNLPEGLRLQNQALDKLFKETTNYLKQPTIVLASALTGYYGGKLLNDFLEGNGYTKNVPSPKVTQHELSGEEKNIINRILFNHAEKQDLTKDIDSHVINDHELFFKETEKVKNDLAELMNKENLTKLFIETHKNTTIQGKQIKNLSIKDINGIVDLAKNITVHNEKNKAVREGIVAGLLAVLDIQKEEMITGKMSQGKDLSSWLITSFFDTYRAGETVWNNKAGYGKTYWTNGKPNWAAFGKTATYLLAGIVQIKTPSLLSPRWKPLEKWATRSLINKGLEMAFNNSKEKLTTEQNDQKKVDEGLKDILTAGHALYVINKNFRNS